MPGILIFVLVVVLARTLKGKNTQAARGGALAVFGTIAAIALFIGFVSLGAYNFSLHKLWYGIEYGAEAKDISIDAKPHDCDFVKAPLGNKECHFESDTIVENLVKRDDQNIVWVSQDKGQTWRKLEPNEPTPSTKVYMVWNKVADE